ncbi:MAG: hypothetical protein ACETWR_10345 [Anaerolineae bacterium]
MELKSDWLDLLVLREAEDIWIPVTKDDSSDEPPPDSLYIVRCANADWDRLLCQPPVIRAWLYNRAGQRTQIPTDKVSRGYNITGDEPLEEMIESPKRHSTNRRFYAVGSFKFHITADRRHVMMNYTFGPLYAAGWVSRVSGHGTTAKLERDPGFGMWAA